MASSADNQKANKPTGPQALRDALYRSAKQDPKRRFHALFDKVYRADILTQAWNDVADNDGAPGVDGVSIDDIKAGGPAAVGPFLEALAGELKDHSYRPSPLRRVHIPKPGKPGQTRPLGIPTVKDRVVMAAAKAVLEPIFEADFSDVSYGFRPGRSIRDALEAVRQTANRGFVWVLDADIKACFDNIDHDALMRQVERRVFDRQMLKLLRSWLRAGIFEGGVVSDSEAGTPQGSPISPLLANIALHVLDEAWAVPGRHPGRLVRYADDFVVFCPTKQRAEAARALAAHTLAPLGLHLHPDKTRIVCIKGGDEGFIFLGFYHRMVESKKWRGRFYLQKWPSPKAMASIRAKVRDRTARRYVGRSLDRVVGDLNPVLRGWGNHYAVGNSTAKFAEIDSYVHERLALLTSRKHGRHGRSWASRYTWAWYRRLGVHRLAGTVRYRAAHA